MKISIIIIFIFTQFCPAIFAASDFGTWSSQQEFESGNAIAGNACDIDGQRFAVSYCDKSDGYAGKMRIGKIVGTTITWGAISEFDSDIYVSSDTGTATGICYLGDNKVVVAYSDDGSSDDLYARVATLSGTTISSWGTAKRCSTDLAFYIRASRMEDDKFVIGYKDDNNDNGEAVVCTVSGTTITSGTPKTLDANDGGGVGLVAIENEDAFYFTCCIGTNQKLFYCTVSGTTITEVDSLIIPNSEPDMYWSIVNILQGTKFICSVNQSNDTYSFAGDIVNDKILTTSGNTLVHMPDSESGYYLGGCGLNSNTFLTVTKTSTGDGRKGLISYGTVNWEDDIKCVQRETVFYTQDSLHNTIFRPAIIECGNDRVVIINNESASPYAGNAYVAYVNTPEIV